MLQPTINTPIQKARTHHYQMWRTQTMADNNLGVFWLAPSPAFT
jgi:hypothetical protein